MDIATAILEITLEGAIKTRIMYSAFLSYPQLKEYLQLLTDSRLLAFSEEDRKYYTTEKGRRFLEISAEVGQLIAPKARRDEPRRDLLQQSRR
jgi:predicted transcriptional regulator